MDYMRSTYDEVFGLTDKKEIQLFMDYNQYKNVCEAYESPIKIIYDAMQAKIEDDVYKVVQRYEIVVDKQELIRALQYDRNQFERGYHKGYFDAMNDKKEGEINE